ncbi:transporter substrate-binding domain-containing protein [Curvibacter sp. APW13]|uniref:transporter substrate-binding domain-containing protein n=1 Tax=Curvibacter sp. APW13 TaxID=3077236 RepID=UPI0028DFB8AB|nr:transporter substrate-binding domain-containing protein [Curvibacter sp. APW13]MDT8990019.1 transporter substrate-binding domain-containing protein [Curvibacter sp. APW13]
MANAKKSLRKLLVFTLAAGMIGALSLAAWQWRYWIKPIRIGVEGGYPPFSKKEADGSVTGLEIDWANLFCARMRARCELVPTEFDSLIPDLQAGRIDAIMASLSITEKRLKQVDFSQSYYSVPSAWIAKRGAYQFVLPGEWLGTKKVAVLKGSPREQWLVENYRNLERKAVSSEADAYKALSDGSADFAFTSILVAKTKFLGTPEGAGFEVVGNPTWLNTGAGGGVGVAVRKGDVDMKKAFDKAIAATIRSGEYKQAAARYVDFDLNERM